MQRGLYFLELREHLGLAYILLNSVSFYLEWFQR